MSFTSTFFLFLFFPLSVAGYYLIRSELRKLFLLIASIAFYAVGEPKLVLLLLISILVNYGFGLLIGKVRTVKVLGGLILFLSLAWNFGVLFYYKYLAFAVLTINQLFGSNLLIPEIALPIGISFFTFRTVSYCVEVYWQTCPAQKNLISLALYISFFPQITMGPITKYSVFESQLKNRQVSFDLFVEGVKKIIVGLAKKLILANQLAVMVDAIFALQDGERTVVAAWLGIIGYLLQLYYDFSGYSDMASGMGNLFGFHTPENFRYPYLSKNVAEFWARWHITLGTWLKDYLYTPVFRSVNGKQIPVLNKKVSIQYADYIALLAVWTFAGIWHGAAWKYVLYGYYHCLFIITERIRDNYFKKRRKRLKLKKQPETRLQAAISHVYFLLVIIFGQLLFRVSEASDFFPYAGSMFGTIGNRLNDAFTMYQWGESMVVFLIGILFCFPIVKKARQLAEKYVVAQKIHDLFSPILYILLLVISLSFAITSTYQSFIYFQF